MTKNKKFLLLILSYLILLTGCGGSESEKKGLLPSLGEGLESVASLTGWIARNLPAILIIAAIIGIIVLVLVFTNIFQDNCRQSDEVRVKAYAELVKAEKNEDSDDEELREIVRNRYSFLPKFRHKKKK